MDTTKVYCTTLEEYLPKVVRILKEKTLTK